MPMGEYGSGTGELLEISGRLKHMRIFVLELTGIQHSLHRLLVADGMEY